MALRHGSAARDAREELLSLLRRRGCATTDALAVMAGIARSSAYYALSSLLRRCAVSYYALPYSVGAWCADGPPWRIIATCNGGLVAVDVAAIVSAVAGLVERGTRGVRPARLAARELGLDCERGSATRVVAGVLAAVLDGCAVRERRSGSLLLLVSDPRAALERLRRIAETGALPLRPAPPGDGCGGASRRHQRMVQVTFWLPRWLLAAVDELVARGEFPNRSAALRAAVEELVRRRAGGGT